MRIDKALVTGGAGFIGSHVVDKLVGERIEVVVLDNLSTGSRRNVHPSAMLVEGDVCDLALVKKLALDVDVVFHQAARVSIRKSIGEFYEDATVNLLGTLNVLKAISESRKVKKLIYASSMAVYSEARYLPIREDHPTEPVSPYGIAKLASEKYCLQVAQQHGFDVLILRYFNTFGPRQTLTPYVGVITIFINLALEHRPPVIFGNGKQTRDFVHVEDVADANILAMKSEVGRGIFNIGSGKGTAIAEVARMVLERINPAMRPDYGPKQPGEPTDSVADISRATDVLNFRPKWTLDDKLDELINWWKDQPRDLFVTAHMEGFVDSVRARPEVA